MQPEQLAVGPKQGISALPEPAGLPQPARFRVPDGGDRDPDAAGESRLGESVGARYFSILGLTLNAAFNMLRAYLLRGFPEER